MTMMRVVGEFFFWYRLTWVFPDKFHRAVKRLFVCEVDHIKSHSTNDKLSLKGAWSCHMTNLKFLVPLKYPWNS